MAQHDYVLDNATGANFRSDLNNALLAISSNNSGSSAPSTTYALQFYADTSNNILKLRNAANDGFINLFTLAGGVDVDAASNFNEDVTFTGASASIVFDKSADSLEFRDNAKAVFGTGDDLTISHNGSDSIINDAGTGSLKLQLGGSTKAEVVSGGLTVTGTVTATTLAGTLSTAAQTSVTSLGTLTGLTISGDTTFTGDSANIVFDKSDNQLEFADNAKAEFGTGGDLEIFHNGTNSIISNITGAFKVLLNSDDNAIVANQDGAVELYFDNAKKAETVTGGFTVTGTCTATAFAGDGSALTGVGGTTINNNADNRVITGSGTANTLNGESNVVIDSSGRLLVGTGHSASRNVGDLTAKIQLEGAGYNQASLSLMSNAGASAGNTAHFTMGKSRGSSNGDNTVVADGDVLGQFQFAGADGTDCNSVACNILGRVDGTPGSNDMPGALTFQTTADGAASPTERMRIDSSGNILIGATSYSGGGADPKLYVSGTSGRTMKIHGGSATSSLQLTTSSTGEGEDAGLQIFEAGSTAGINNKNGETTFSATNVEVMRILSGNDGNDFTRVLIGTSVETFAMVCLKVAANLRQPLSINDSSNTSTFTSRIGFRTGNTQVGIIKSSSSATQYNTSSDYRLKENAVAISDGITRIKTLKPYKFNWIVDETNTPVDGFFAHEVSDAVPEAISGTKDQIADAADVARGDAEKVGDPVHQQIDQSKLVPLLVAAVQELVTKVEALEAA
tara:strand:+ start:1135 stop:3345 length:2211 start_codon:yes stop_codon:yes gene_type:complete